MRQSRLFLISVALFFVVLCIFLVNQYLLTSKLRDARQKLMMIASNAAMSIDADTLLKIPLQMDADKTQEYKVVFDRLQRIKEANPSVKYIYILSATDEAGILQYVVDADPLPEIVTAKSPTSFSGDKFDARNDTEMLQAYNGPNADKKIVTDAWGVTLSGYAPIRNNMGKAIAILCVDVDASQEYSRKNQQQVLAIFVLLAAILSITAFVLKKGVKNG